MSESNNWAWGDRLTQPTRTRIRTLSNFLHSTSPSSSHHDSSFISLHLHCCPMSSEPLTKAQSDVRAAHRLHHIEILAKLAADPGNPRRRTHADELHRVQVAQRAYENEKAQGHPSSQSLPVGVNKPSLLGRLGQPSHSSSWGHDGRIGRGGRRFGQRAGVRDDDRHRPQSPSAYYGGAPYPDSIPVTIGTGHSAINALRSDGARVIR